MNNEWNDEVVVDVSESDITVDQAYDATSSNPQSGTAVAQAVAQAGGTVDQHYNADSRNAQSGRAVTEALYLNRPLTTTQASQTEIDIDVKGDAPIKLIAEDYGSVSGPSVAATFKVAHMKTSGGPTGIEIVFDLPTPQLLPVNVQFVVNSDITGSLPPRYAFIAAGCFFGAAENDTLITSPVYPVNLSGVGIIGNENHSILAGSYNLSLTSGNPSYVISQVSVLFDGVGENPDWTDLCDYIIANASTLFSLSIPSTIKTARLLPASTSSDADKVLTVNASGKPAWATAASGGVPVLQSLTCQVSNGAILAELPSGQFLEPGLYQVFLEFGMDEYDSSYKHIRFGYQVDHADNIIASAFYDPVNIDSNGPFSNAAKFRRTGYVKVSYEGEISGFYIVFSNGTSSVSNSILNHVSLTYMKVADLS